MFNDMSQTLVIMRPSATTTCTFQMRSDRNFVGSTQVLSHTDDSYTHVGRGPNESSRGQRQLRPSSKERISLIPQARMRSARLVGDERGRRP